MESLNLVFKRNITDLLLWYTVFFHFFVFESWGAISAVLEYTEATVGNANLTWCLAWWFYGTREPKGLHLVVPKGHALIEIKLGSCTCQAYTQSPFSSLPYPVFKYSDF